tara:strand:- start:3880 stop:4782 length:903 start_codon:yes stop_codon:yes gene_type:complete
MIKKDMKKIYENLFFISKFSISFILLICLIAVLYVFFINYQNESKISQNNILKNNELKNDIRNNLDLIKNISEELKSTQLGILEIKNNLKSINKKDISSDNTKIIDEIKILNNNFLNLSNEIEIIKNNNLVLSSKSNKQPNIINDSKGEIIDLIIIKYENNIDFNREIDFLKEISSEAELASFEKIMMLINKPFKGYKYLKNTFRNEANQLLKKTIIQNKDSLLNNIILPYLEVSPSTENIIEDPQVILLGQISKELDNKNIKKAFDDLQSINNYEAVFSATLFEMNKYIKFTDTLHKIN